MEDTDIKKPRKSPTHVEWDSRGNLYAWLKRQADEDGKVHGTRRSLAAVAEEELKFPVTESIITSTMKKCNKDNSIQFARTVKKKAPPAVETDLTECGKLADALCTFAGMFARTWAQLEVCAPGFTMSQYDWDFVRPLAVAAELQRKAVAAAAAAVAVITTTSPAVIAATQPPRPPVPPAPIVPPFPPIPLSQLRLPNTT